MKEKYKTLFTYEKYLTKAKKKGYDFETNQNKAFHELELEVDHDSENKQQNQI